MPRSRNHLAAAAAGALLAGAGAHAQYTLEVLPDYFFGPGSMAAEINNTGDVAGTVNSGFNFEASLWRNGQITLVAPGVGGAATGLNNTGTVVGNLDLGDSETSGLTPFLWNNGQLDFIFDGLDFSLATGVSDAGLVSGTVNGQAAIWSSAGGTRILTFDGASDGFGNGNAVSANGFVVGAAVTPDSGFNTHAFRYDEAGGMLDLGTLGGAFSEAFGVNDHGDVVGFSSRGDGTDAGFLYRDGQIIDLGLFEGEFSGRAVAVNNNGQVVGQDGGGFFSTAIAWIWEDGQKTALADLVAIDPGFEIVEVFDINDNGDILVNIREISTFTTFGAVLRVPAPGAATLGFGAIALGALRRRR
jgi:probable HAF family extracellular repeat protein